jgi:hypothetical protein
MAEIVFKAKKVSNDLSQNRNVFNENNLSGMSFEPRPVFEFLTDQEVSDLREDFISASLGYNPRDLSGSIDTNLLDEPYGPFKRLGRYVGGETIFVTRSIAESSDVGGTRIGRQTIFGDAQDITALDALRQGKNVITLSHFDKKLAPMVRISPEGMFTYDDVIQHNFGGEYYGQGLEFKTFDENFIIIPFKDFGKLTPSDLLGKESVLGYPIVHDTVQNFDQYVDPSYSGFDGAIDLFMTRTSLINSSFDFIPYGLRSDYMGGSVEEVKRGSAAIESAYEIKEGSKTFFLDSQETLFSNFQSGSRSDLNDTSGYKFALPGLITSDIYKKSPFTDEDYLRYNDDKYTFVNSSAKNQLLSSSDNNVSVIGTRFKSSNCGLIFGESNVLGTDSIAFGGLRK